MRRGSRGQDLPCVFALTRKFPRVITSTRLDPHGRACHRRLRAPHGSRPLGGARRMKPGDDATWKPIPTKWQTKSRRHHGAGDAPRRRDFASASDQSVSVREGRQRRVRLPAAILEGIAYAPVFLGSATRRNHRVHGWARRRPRWSVIPIPSLASMRGDCRISGERCRTVGSRRSCR